MANDDLNELCESLKICIDDLHRVRIENKNEI